MQTSQRTTQKFLIKFFPEIMVKGNSARKLITGHLYSNIMHMLTIISKDMQFKKFSDKIEIVCPINLVVETRQRLLDTPGIELVLEALQFDDVTSLDMIKTIVNDNMKHTIQNKSFVIRAKRAGKHDFRSPQIEQNVGGYMLAKNDTSRVDLHNPEKTIRIELIHNQLNIITHKHRGLGGYPLGSQGEILSLMSGGFDSTVASYLTMKRGLKTHFVFFNLGGIAHEIGVKQVALYLWDKFGSSNRVTFTSVPFDDVITEIFRSTGESYMGVTLKRLMLKASQSIANELGIDALLTGESIAQVSSQTLRNLALIDKSIDMLVIRPLATMNKPDIISIANEIGTRHFAENMPEYCGVISKNPITHGSFIRMEREAVKFDYSVLDKAVQNATQIKVDEIITDIEDIGQLETISDVENGDYTIIDIRAEENCIQASCESIKIPFYKLKSEFLKLPQDKEYILYCEKGILSQLHGQYLKDEHNCKNIRVYRP